jgi:uncharacterized protein YdeI (YjbR/CyaY-like superfamily)
MASTPLQFRDAVEWRRWLEAHHATETEALLVLSKKSVSDGLHYIEALEEALCFGWIDGKLRAHDARRFVQRFTPRRPDSIWSVANRDRVERLTRQGRIAPAGVAVVEAAQALGTWAQAVQPGRVPPIPADLKAALRTNSKAWANFRGWGNSYRIACIRWVMDAKRPETRERHIRRIVQRAAQNRRPGIEGF